MCVCVCMYAYPLHTFHSRGFARSLSSAVGLFISIVYIYVCMYVVRFVSTYMRTPPYSG